ncbi:MAG: hypothetical protein ACKOQM_10470 [Novosphingobium sp.]
METGKLIVQLTVAYSATAIPPFALEISTKTLMWRSADIMYRRQTGENPMRSIYSIVLPAIIAISISGLMFTATLA